MKIGIKVPQFAPFLPYVKYQERKVIRTQKKKLDKKYYSNLSKEVEKSFSFYILTKNYEFFFLENEWQFKLTVAKIIKKEENFFFE